MNEIICHGIPDRRPLQNGDIVNVDVTACYGGYHGDLNETYVVGEVDDASKKLLQVAYQVTTRPAALPPCLPACTPWSRARLPAHLEPKPIPSVLPWNYLGPEEQAPLLCLMFVPVSHPAWLLTDACVAAVPGARHRAGEAGHQVSGPGRRGQPPRQEPRVRPASLLPRRTVSRLSRSWA